MIIWRAVAVRSEGGSLRHSRENGNPGLVAVSWMAAYSCEHDDLGSLRLARFTIIIGPCPSPEI